MSTKKRKRRKVSPAGMLLLLVMFLAVIIAVYGMFRLLISAPETSEEPTIAETVAETETLPPTEPPTEAPTEPPPLMEYPVRNETTKTLGAELNAEYAILIDTETNTVLAQKNADVRMYPASMTKLMTLIVAIENIENFQDTFTMTQDILDELYAQDASMAGFVADEPCTIMDMLYGASLPSGADATTGLACYVAGSERAFVRMMNKKVKQLGLKDTHFMNTSGLHDEKHYTTASDMAVILNYCLQNELCRKLISTPTYVTTPTEQHPDGIPLSDTMFNKMEGTEVPGITIKGGKTGFTDEAGQCLASYAETPDGKRYLAITAKGTDRYQPVYDAFTLYGSVTGTYPTEAETAETPAIEQITPEIPAA